MPLEPLGTFDAHRSVDCLAFSPDGELIATGGNDPGNVGNTIKLWDAQSLRLLHRLKAGKGGLLKVAFSADGSFVAAGGRDGMLRLWNARNGELIWATKGHTGVVWAVAFSPDGRTIATGGRDGQLLIWDRQTSEVFRAHSEGFGVLSVSFSADGKTLISAEGQERQSSAVVLHSVPTGKILHKWGRHCDWPLWAEFSPDGLHVGSGSYGELLVRMATSGVIERTFKPELWSMVAFSFSANGAAVAAGGWSHSAAMNVVPGGLEQVQTGRLQVWNVRTGNTIGSVVAHDRGVTAVRFSPSGGLVATAGRDGTIKLWKVKDR